MLEFPSEPTEVDELWDLVRIMYNMSSDMYGLISPFLSAEDSQKRIAMKIIIDNVRDILSERESGNS